MTNTKFMNAKAFYEANKDIAEVTYAWFIARIRSMHKTEGDSGALFKTGWYYFIDANGLIFKEMLRRGTAGRLADASVKIGDLIKD